MRLIIIWLIAGVLTLISDDKSVLKINFMLTWITLMVQLIANI